MSDALLANLSRSIDHPLIIPAKDVVVYTAQQAIRLNIDVENECRFLNTLGMINKSIYINAELGNFSTIIYGVSSLVRDRVVNYYLASGYRVYTDAKNLYSLNIQW